MNADKSGRGLRGYPIRVGILVVVSVTFGRFLADLSWVAAIATPVVLLGGFLFLESRDNPSEEHDRIHLSAGPQFLGLIWWKLFVLIGVGLFIAAVVFV